MTAVLEKLTLYWAYPFVRYALIVGVLIALCSSLLGVTLVLKRFSFIGDGLSHVAFGAMAIAAVLQITNEMPLVMVITIIIVTLRRKGSDALIIKHRITYRVYETYHSLSSNLRVIIENLVQLS